MSLRFYDTASRRIETFEPLEEGRVGMYTCGPTVWDFAHIGNFRSYVFEDLVKRYLRYLGYRVFHVMNITDIDDKTIRRSNELGCSLEEVTDRYIAAFFKDIDILNILRADEYPRATRHIDDMVEMIAALIGKGYAYERAGSVYFSVDRFPEYGRLANIDRGELVAGLRVDADEYDRHSVQDFVLWKARKEGEPFWDTPFGPGRPGWHIECSAMSMKYLGNHFDIHMGGVDNIFPHHENEIAQSRCATGSPFVNYWLHCQHLIVENQKMSKSLGNYYLLQDLLNRGHDAMAIRYLLLSTHYRKLLNFSLSGLDMAKQSLRRISDFVFNLRGLAAPQGRTDEIDAVIERSESDFQAGMNDDFNISAALGTLFDFIHQVNVRMETVKEQDVKNILGYMNRIDSVLGVIDHDKPQKLDDETMQMISEREAARKARDFKRADEIRGALLKKGIVLLDTPDGVRWKFES